MTSKQFINALANGSVDVIALLVAVIEKAQAQYCIVGGLAVNAYADPVVSLDLDVVVSDGALESICAAAEAAGFSVERFPNSVNLAIGASDLRVQVQTDPRYQAFLMRAVLRPVLGYALQVAHIEDVLLGKSWAYLDPSRRPSKRQKDLADILRLIEAQPALRDRVPAELGPHLPV